MLFFKKDERCKYKTIRECWVNRVNANCRFKNPPKKTKRIWFGLKYYQEIWSNAFIESFIKKIINLKTNNTAKLFLLLLNVLPQKVLFIESLLIIRYEYEIISL